MNKFKGNLGPNFDDKTRVVSSDRYLFLAIKPRQGITEIVVFKKLPIDNSLLVKMISTVEVLIFKTNFIQVVYGTNLNKSKLIDISLNVI